MGRGIAIIICGVAAQVPQFAAAQVAGADNLSEGQEAASSGRGIHADAIVVTARRREENIQDVPLAINYVDGRTIEQGGFRTNADIQKLPGVFITPQSGLQNVGIAMRGQGVGFATGQPSVIPYFAEVPNFPVTFFDLANVQVLKGPQGTLFGETATSGAILYSPRRPTEEVEGNVVLQAGDLRYRSIEAVVSGPIVGNSLLGRIGVQWRKRAGYSRAFFTTGEESKRMNDFDNITLRGSLVWRPADDVENYTVVSFQRSKTNGTSSPLLYADPRFMPAAVRDLSPAAIPVLAAQFKFWTGMAPPPGRTYGQLMMDALDRQQELGPYASVTNYDHRSVSESYGVINQTKWEASDHLTIKNIFGMTWNRSKGTPHDIDGTGLSLLDTRNYYQAGTINPNMGKYAWLGGTPSATYTNEIQLLGDFGDRLQWQAGLYYRDGGERAWSPATGRFVAFGNPSGDPASPALCASLGLLRPCSTLQKFRSRTIAPYIQTTFKITPGLKLTAGYRHTWDYRKTSTTATEANLVDFEGFRFPVPTTGRNPSKGSLIQKLEVPWSSASSYNITADYQVSPDILLYIAHRRGYKSGGINQNQLADGPFRQFGPETIQDIEFGAKASFEFGGARFSTSLAAYQSWYSDIQRTQSIPGTALTYTSNSANGKIKGLEFEGRLETTWFDLSANLNLTDAYYTDWTETKSCVSEGHRPQCAGLPGDTPVTIDRAKGRLTVNGQVISFTPDVFSEAPKVSWSISPRIKLENILKENISLTGTVYHRAKLAGSVSAVNSSFYAGMPFDPVNTVLGVMRKPPFLSPSYTRVDVRFDWRSIYGSNFSVAGAVTNLTNEKVNIASASAFPNVGATYSVIDEPRLFYLELKYEF